MVKYMYKSNIAFNFNSMEINKKNNKLDVKNLHFNKLINFTQTNRQFKQAIRYVDCFLYLNIVNIANLINFYYEKEYF